MNDVSDDDRRLDDVSRDGSRDGVSEDDMGADDRRTDDRTADAEIRRWLTAEARAVAETVDEGATPEATAGTAREAEREAEEALLQAFAALPSPSPSAGFADRVLARAGDFVPPSAARPARFWQWAVAASVLLAGLVSPLWGPLALELFSQVDWTAALQWPGEALLALGQWLGRGLTLWESLARFSAAVAQAVARPAAAAVLALALAVVTLAFRLLSRLIVHERSVSYVEAV